MTRERTIVAKRGSETATRVLLAVTLSAALLAACDRKKEETPPDAAPGPGPVAVGIPVDAGEVRAVLNPKNEPAYSGPVGKLRGVVRVSGDEVPENDKLETIPAECGRAQQFYEKVFREGPGRTLGDVLVTVTGYTSYLPATSESVTVEADGCAWNTRTVALTYGQRIEAVNKDTRPYVPELIGVKRDSQLVMVPKGDPIKLYPNRPGARFGLVDSMRLFMYADVFVLKYPTVDVTGLDGRYEINGIPAGEVTVTAFLPAIMKHVQKKVRIDSQKPAVVDFEIPFDAATYEAADTFDAGTVTEKSKKVVPRLMMPGQ